MMTPIAILVAGTHGHKDSWWKPGQDFVNSMERAGIRPADRYDPYAWCTNIDGLFGGNTVWETAGSALRWYAESKVRHYPVSIIAHSHGGQVAAFAAAQGLKVERLVTVATPVRKDMDAVYKAAKNNVYKWYHLHSDTDLWQVLGGLRDGKWGIHRAMPYADHNVMIQGVDHSDFLKASLWNERELWGWLK